MAWKAGDLFRKQREVPMKEAALAALPWIFMAFAILIFTLQREKRDRREKEKQHREKHTLERWMCFGMVLGMLLGLLIPVLSPSYSVSLGILLGVLLGAYLQKKEAKASIQIK